MTRTETEALRKPDALPYGIDSRNRIRSDSGSETVITFCIGTGRATRTSQRRCSTRARRGAAPIRVGAVKGTPKTSENQTSRQHR